MPVTNPPTATKKVIKARIRPSGCVINAVGNSPRTVWLQAVVIPHVGHGTSAARIHPHSGSPSWRCVPTPSLDGFSINATERSTTDISATPKAWTRLVRSDFSGTMILLIPSCSSTIDTGYPPLIYSGINCGIEKYPQFTCINSAEYRKYLYCLQLRLLLEDAVEFHFHANLQLKLRYR